MCKSMITKRVKTDWCWCWCLWWRPHFEFINRSLFHPLFHLHHLQCIRIKMTAFLFEIENIFYTTWTCWMTSNGRQYSSYYAGEAAARHPKGIYTGRLSLTPTTHFCPLYFSRPAFLSLPRLPQIREIFPEWKKCCSNDRTSRGAGGRSIKRVSVVLKSR